MMEVAFGIAVSFTALLAVANSLDFAKVLQWERVCM